jgi:hypothetical protein
MKTIKTKIVPDIQTVIADAIAYEQFDKIVITRVVIDHPGTGFTMPGVEIKFMMEDKDGK